MSEHTYQCFQVFRMDYVWLKGYALTKSKQSWLKGLEGTQNFRHLIVMSGVPLVYNDLSFLESVLEILPGQQVRSNEALFHRSL